MVAPLRRALGTDVSAIPVRRGAAVGVTAHELGARAYTTDGVVHIPDHAGALDGHDAIPLLAHELTHAVQQRRFGAALPTPGSALARELEDEAVAVEGWIGRGAVEPPPLVVRQLAVDGVDDLDTGALIREFEEETGSPFTFTDEDHRMPDVSVGGLLAAYQDLRRLAADQDDDNNGGGGTPEENKTPGGDVVPDVGELMDLIADNPPRRWLDLDDSDHFEEIANRLYHHLLARLRFDVLVERERSGTLLDFS